MKRLLSIVGLLAGCAHSMPGLVDSEIWYRDCKPYRFPRDLQVIVPQSPGSTVMSAEAAPKRALVKRAECAASGSWQVVDLVPSKPEGSSPAVSVSGPARYDLRDVPPPFGDPR